MEELQEQITLATSDKEARYFYHLTSQAGDKLLEEGIIVANPEWEKSFLEFTDEELSDIESVIDSNASTEFKQNNTMIIVGVYKDSMKRFIRRLRDDEAYDIDWEGVGTPDFIVDSDHIIGYIDLNTLEFVYNERSNVWSGFYDL